MKPLRQAILLDSESTHRKEVRISLDSGDYRIITIDSATDLFRACRERLPHVIIVAVGGDALDGYEVCAEIKRLYHVPVILTGDPARRDEGRFKSSGADDFLPRPSNSMTIIAALERRLDRVAAAQETAGE